MALRRLWRRLRVVLAVVFALVLVGWVGWLIAIAWRPAAHAFPRQGVDVSEKHGDIDWFEVKAAAGIDFAYVRATIGADRRDARFAANWNRLYAAGVPRGAIHVFSLCQLATDQAGNFVATVPRAGDPLPMAVELDFQPGCAARPDRDVVLLEIRHFLDAVEPQTRKPALLKVTKAFEARYRVSEGLPRQLWSVQPFFPPAYFDKPWTMWQAHDFRRIEGVAAPVNWDVMAR